MVLPSLAARGLLAPFPNHLAVPVELGDGSVAEDAFAIVFVVLVLNQDMAASPTIDRRIDEVARLAGIFPSMRLFSVRIDKVGFEVERTEAD
jgi:hypothetical protein